MQNAPRMPAIWDDHQQHQREHNPAKSSQHLAEPAGAAMAPAVLMSFSFVTKFMVIVL
jgi:hypothetical protein